MAEKPAAGCEWEDGGKDMEMGRLGSSEWKKAAVPLYQDGAAIEEDGLTNRPLGNFRRQINVICRFSAGCLNDINQVRDVQQAARSGRG
jgi:hypothetical protein